MSTALATEPTNPSTDGDDEIEHIVCCDQARALCGADLTDGVLVEPGPPEDVCVVCADLDKPNRPCSPECIAHSP